MAQVIRQASRRMRTGLDQPERVENGDRRPLQLDQLQNRTRTDSQTLACSKEAEDRLRRISTWSTERLVAARDEVGRRFRTMANKSLSPDAWTSAYTAFLVVADEDLQTAEEKGAV